MKLTIGNRAPVEVDEAELLDGTAIMTRKTGSEHWTERSLTTFDEAYLDPSPGTVLLAELCARGPSDPYRTLLVHGVHITGDAIRLSGPDAYVLTSALWPDAGHGHVFLTQVNA